MRISLDLRYKTESGGSTYIREMTAALLSLDDANHYVLVRYRDQRFAFENRASAVIIAPRWPNMLELLWTITVLPWLLRRHRVDVHHGLKSPVPYWNWAATVVTMHSTHDNYKGEHYVSLAMRLYFWLYGNRVFRPATAVIAVSHFLKDGLIEHHQVQPEKVHVAYNGVGAAFRQVPTETINAVLARYDLTPGYILCIGNVTVVKNHITAIRALGQIADRTDVQLVIAGATEHRNSNYPTVAKEIEEFKLKDRVRFLGFVEIADLVPVINGARMTIFPSFNEGFGLALVESFKCGVPAIASSIGPLAEIGRDRALLLQDPRDYRSLAGLIENLLKSDDLHAELRQRSLAAAEEFTWQKSALGHLDVYRWCHLRKRSKAGLDIQAQDGEQSGASGMPSVPEPLDPRH